MPERAVGKDGQILTINGIPVDSLEEHRVGVALFKLKIPFNFQWLAPVYIAGQRGSTVVDFLVKVPPLPVPLFVDGAYVHGGQQRQQDELVRAQLYQAMAGKIAVPVSVSDALLKDQAAADAQMYLLFGGR